MELLVKLPGHRRLQHYPSVLLIVTIASVLGSYSCIRSSLVGNLQLYPSNSRTASGGADHSAASSDAAACLKKEVKSSRTSPFTTDDFVNARPARYHSTHQLHCPA